MPFCPQCGAEYEPGDRFCSNCGYKLQKTQAAEQSKTRAGGLKSTNWQAMTTVEEAEPVLAPEKEAEESLPAPSLGAKSFLLHYLRPIGEGLGVALVLGLLYIIIGVKFSKAYITLDSLYAPLQLGFGGPAASLWKALVWSAVLGIGAAWSAKDSRENGFLCGAITGFLAGLIFSLVEDLVLDWATCSIKHTLGASMMGLAIGLIIGFIAGIVGSPALVRFPQRARQTALICVIVLVGMLIVFMNLPNMPATKAYVLGSRLQQHGLYQAAIEKYEYALRLRPNDVNILNDLGVALKHVGRIEDAISQWEIAGRLNPTFAQVHHNLGIAYHETGRLDAAIEQYKLALRADPEDYTVLYNLGIAYLRKDRYDDAERIFNLLLANEPNNPDAQRALEQVKKLKAEAQQPDGG